jgi:serine/threonine-protein kinase RsbT
MNILLQGEVKIEAETDIVTARRAVRDVAAKLGFGTTDTTRIVTAASEMARNVFKYAGTGVMHWLSVADADGPGMELRFEDHGPGIADLDEALRPGSSTGRGLGMGLPGAKRLMDEMEIQSVVGAGTTVVLRKWLRTSIR